MTSDAQQLGERLSRLLAGDYASDAPLPHATESHEDASQPSEPPQRERDQEKEKLLALADGLQEDRVAVKFRDGLMERISLQEKYEPGFDKAKAIAEANKLIKAVNKSHALARQGAKKRMDVEVARTERKPDEREVKPQVAQALALEIERMKQEEAALKAEAMERSLKAFMRGNAPLVQPAMQLGLAPQLEGREITGPMMEGAIAQMMERLNLREPEGMGVGSLPMMPAAMGRGAQLALAA